MKQIDMIKAYSQKRCLVVDGNPDQRTLLKRTLVDFGSENVDTAAHADESIELCQKRSYDIVLADYELGKGKNGLQLLEELRYQALLKHSAIFFLVSSEVGVQHVVHAVENRPDDYVSKPVNRETLRPRLDLAVQKKEALAPVNQALDRKRPRSAIAACQDLLQGKGKFQQDIKKLLGELLCQQNFFEEARTLYEDMPQEKRPLWASLGLAKANIGLKDYAPAESLLKNIIDTQDYCVEAHDLLARVYEAQNKPELAQGAMMEAITVSPMSANRQREMGRISNEAGDKNAAAHALRAAIKYSKNSCQENAEDYTGLAQTLSDMMETGDVESLAEEALEVLKYASKKYGRQPVVSMSVELVSADVYDGMGLEEKSQEAEQKALSLFEGLNFSVIENTSTHLCIDCAKAFMARGKYDEGEKLLQEVSKLNHSDDLAIKIDKLLREPMTKEGIAFAAKLNKQGIEFHKNSKFEQAAGSFQKVLHELPNHIGLNLNLIQSLISKSKDQPLSDKELSLIESSFQRIGELRDDAPYKERYEYLNKRYLKMKK